MPIARLRTHPAAAVFTSAALVAGLLSVFPVSATAAPVLLPTTIELAADREYVSAGEEVTLTATTDEDVEDSSSIIAIVDQTTATTLETCDTGDECIATARIDSGGPHTYTATVGLLASDEVIVERTAWSLGLTAADETVTAGETTIVTAAADQDVSETGGAYQIYIFDNIAETFVQTCDTGSTCEFETPAFLGWGQQDYLAFVAATGEPETIEDLLDIQATAELLTVRAEEWTVELTADVEEVGLGESATLTATANQDVGGTASGYQIYIFDSTAEVLLESCDTGDVCTVDTAPATGGAGHDYIAYVAASGTPATVGDITDILAQSEFLPVSATGWETWIQADRWEFWAGESATLTAYANQDVGDTSDAYAIYIFDQTTGTLVKTCTTGTACEATVSFLTGGSHDYIAAVAATGTPPDLETAEDVLAVSWNVTVSRASWYVTASLSVHGLPVNGVARLTANTEQSLSDTDGEYALYWFNSVSGERVGTCISGTTCIVTIYDSSSTDPNIYVAYVAAATTPDTIDDLVDVQAMSNVVATPDEYTLAINPSYEISAPGSLNSIQVLPSYDIADLQDGITPVAILVFDVTTNTLIGQCDWGNPNLLCDVEVNYDDSASEHSYRAIIADATDPETIQDAVHVISVSDDVTITMREWDLTLDFDSYEFELYAPITMTVTIDPVLPVDPNYNIHVYDETTGEVVPEFWCSPYLGTCSQDRGGNGRWDRPALYTTQGEHTFVATLAHWENPTDILATSNHTNVMRKPLAVSLDISTDVFTTTEVPTFTAYLNQGFADGLMIWDLTAGQGISICGYGYVMHGCIDERFPFPRGTHEIVAFAYDCEGGTYYCDPPTAADVAAGNRILAISEPVEVTAKSWTMHLTVTITPKWYNPDILETSFSISANQALNYNAPTYHVYNYGTGVNLGYCSFGCGYWYEFERSSPTPCFVVRMGDFTNWHGPGWPTLESATSIDATSPCATVIRPPIDTSQQAQGGGNPSQKNSQCYCADPVNTATGEFFLPVSDIGIEGAGPALEVARTYSSTRAAENGPFGYGWTANFTSHLEVVEPGTSGSPEPREVRITQENGSTVDFVGQPTGGYLTDPGNHATLSWDVVTGGFTFTRQSSEILSFDSDGRLVAFRDLHGNATTLGRDISGRVTTLTASGGRTLTLDWTGGRVTQVTDSAGRVVQYTYTGALLTSVTAIDGAVTSYGYDSAHYITTVTAPGGAVTTTVYDSSHRVTSQTDPVGRVTTFVYSGSSTTITAPGGTKTKDVYSAGRLSTHTVAATTSLAATTSYTYDEASNVLTVDDPLGNETSFTYDDDGNVLTTTNPLGRTTHFTYNALDKPMSVVDPLGRISTYTYNSAGDILTSTTPDEHEQTVTYNSDGTVATSVDAAGETTTFGYDSAGRLTSTTDPDGVVSAITYDSAGVLTSTTVGGDETTVVTTDLAGRVLTSTDPDGNVSTFTYDARGNRLTVTDPNGDVATTTYDKLDRPTSVTDAAGEVTEFTYASGGQLAAVTDAKDQTTSHEYDAAGNLVATTDPLDRTTVYGYDKAGHTVSTLLPSGAETTAHYDDAGQLTLVTDATGESTVLGYDAGGQLISATDPIGRVTEYEYTDDGQPATTTLPDLSTQLVTYTVTGQQASFTNPDGKVTTYAYSDAGRLTGKVEPGGLETGLSYDDTGRLEVLTLPDASTQTYEYDDAGRLASVHYSATGSTDTDYGYDDAGRPISVTDATGTTTLTYDDAGRLASETDGDGDTIAYAYDEVGQLTEITYPGADDVSYAYDAAGQMTSLTDWDSHTTSFTWTDDGQLAAQTTPNGIVQTTSYDDAGRTTLIEDATSTAAVLARFGYGYDDAGQVTSDTVTNGGVTTAHVYGYDPLSQLGAVTTAPSGSTPTTAAFDATSAGQLTATALGDTLTYNAAQQLTGLDPLVGPATSYDYDDRGSRTSSTIDAFGGDPAKTTTYDYSPTGALVAVTTPTVAVDYTVDARGLRQSRTAGTATDDFVWSTVSGLPLLLDDGDHRYLYGPGLTPVAQIDGSGDVEYLHGDLLGSVRTITDDSGAVVSTSTFGPFGARTEHTGSTDSRFGFTGNWTDPDTGLVHLRARDYDPAAGQFLSVDPAVDSTQQPYAYTGNSPLQRTDPTGLDFLSSVVSVVGQVAQVAAQAAIEGAKEFAVASACAMDDALAFGAGALDALTWGASGFILGAAVPGYSDFVAGHEAAFTAGSVVATVVQAAVAIIGTGGAGAGLAISLIAIKIAAKSAIKAEARTAIRVEAQAVVRSADNVLASSAEGAAKQGDGPVTYLYQKLSSADEHLKYGTTKNPATRYTSAEMNGGRLNILASGTKSDMLALERSVHEWLPIGPEEGQTFYILKQVLNGLRPPPY